MAIINNNIRHCYSMSRSVPLLFNITGVQLICSFLHQHTSSPRPLQTMWTTREKRPKMHQALPNETKRTNHAINHTTTQKPIAISYCLRCCLRYDWRLFRPFVRGCLMLIVRFGHAHVDDDEWALRGWDWIRWYAVTYNIIII